MVGTLVLVFLSCGTAVSLACGNDTASVVGTACAAGFAVVAMFYTIRSISGCHINPAITIGIALSRRIAWKDAFWYIVFQCIGAIIGSAILFAFTNVSTGFQGTLTGANTCTGAGSQLTGFFIELVLTLILVLVVLGTTDAKKGAGNLAGLVIGLSLTLINFVGIKYTGCGVNPARSIGPALFEGGQALTDLWVFIVAPLCGGALAAFLWKGLAYEYGKCEK